MSVAFIYVSLRKLFESGNSYNTYWSDGGQDTNEQGKSQAKVRVKLTAQMLGWYNNCRDGTTVSFHISAV